MRVFQVTARLAPMVATRSWAVRFIVSLMDDGGSAANTATVLTSVAKPCSTWKGSHGLSAAFSPIQNVYFPGCPRVNFPGLGPAQVEHDQLHRAADRAVRPPAGTEDMGSPINRQPLAYGPIDDGGGNADPSWPAPFGG
jgi:hypothetical protein